MYLQLHKALLPKHVGSYSMEQTEMAYEQKKHVTKSLAIYATQPAGGALSKMLKCF